MAVALRPPRLTLWVAWVCAGALGAAVAGWASQPGSEVFGGTGASYWVPIVLAAPLALLQFLVLRGLAGVSVLAAAMWVGLTLVASAASGYATGGWYDVAPGLLQRGFGVETATDVMFVVGDYMMPLLVGLAQGVVLAWIAGRRWVAVLWIVISVVGYAVAIRLLVLVTPASGFESGTVPGGHVTALAALAALYAAVTGLALVAILRMRTPPDHSERLVRGPAPTAR